MSANNPSEKSRAQRLRTVRMLFAAVLAVLLIAAVSTVVWFIRRDTPAKAVRKVMKQITSQGGTAVSQAESSADPDESIGRSADTLRRFFDRSSYKILDVSREKDSAAVRIRITTPDARSLASDIRIFLLKNPDEGTLQDKDQVYELLDRFLSEREYPPADTEGTVSLTRAKNGWTVRYDEALSSLLLGGLPDALSDPYLLTPQQVLTAYLEKLDSMSVQEWSVLFAVDDLFSTYVPDYEQIDTQFLTRAKDAFSYSDIREETDGNISEVSVDIHGIDTSSILDSYKEKLARYGVTIEAITDDSSVLSEKSAQLLLEAIRENESETDFRVSVTLENDGTGWIITDSSALTDALFGGMSSAAAQFGEDSGGA